MEGSRVEGSRVEESCVRLASSLYQGLGRARSWQFQVEFRKSTHILMHQQLVWLANNAGSSEKADLRISITRSLSRGSWTLGRGVWALGNRALARHGVIVTMF